MPNTPSIEFHRAMSSRRRAIGELVLAVVFSVLLLGIATALVAELGRALGADGLALRLAGVGVGIAMLIPGTRLAARAMGRDPGRLSSVTGRLRWSLLARSTGLALVVTLGGLAALTAIAIAVDGVDAAFAERAWGGLASFLPLALVTLLVIPFQAAGEEYLLRGTLLQVAGAFTRTRWIPIALSAVTFGLLHGYSPQGTVVVVVFGAAAAWLTLRTGGLEAAIGLHVANNVLFLILKAAVSPDAMLGESSEGSWLAVAFDAALVVTYAALVTRSLARRRAAAGPSAPGAIGERNPALAS